MRQVRLQIRYWQLLSRLPAQIERMNTLVAGDIVKWVAQDQVRVTTRRLVEREDPVGGGLA